MKNKNILTILAILSTLGFINSVYLTLKKYISSGSSFCNISQAINCDAVMQSSYSEIFGIPIALISSIFFLCTTIYFIASRNSYALSQIARVRMLFLIGSLFGMYLIYVQEFILNTYCILCLGLDVILFSSLVLLSLVKDRNK